MYAFENGSASYNDAYKQLLGYLKTKNQEKGYLMSFDFRKNMMNNKNPKWVNLDDVNIFDIVI